MCSHVVVTTGVCLGKLASSEEQLWLVAVALVLELPLAIVVLSMVVFHVYLACVSKTTREFYREGNMGKHRFLIFLNTSRNSGFFILPSL